MSRLCLLMLITLAGCAAPYDPPVAGDRASAKYKADITRCRKEADTAATKKANATPQSSLMSLFDSGAAERQTVVACMQVRGYALQTGGSTNP